MNIEELTKPLSIDEIDFRIQSINRGGYATILAYKDARVDINRLNKAVGQGNWQRKHEMIGDRLYCSIGIFNGRDWAWVQDVGTESYTEKEKGQASDSFKRAAFNLGIGIELYEYPFISVKLKDHEWETKDNKPKQTFNLKLKAWKWESEFVENQLVMLRARDEKGNLRFEYKSGNTHNGEQIENGKVDLDKVEKAYAYILNVMDEYGSDEPECAKRLQAACNRLSVDEYGKVSDKLKLIKNGKKLYSTILKEFLDYTAPVGD